MLSRKMKHFLGLFLFICNFIVAQASNLLRAMCMRLLGKFTAVIFSVVFINSVYANHLEQQLLVVTSKNWSADHAQLQLFERMDKQQAWQPVGEEIPVMIGKNGMAKNKKEGDAKVPTGIFSLGTAFGFAQQSNVALKLPYLPITDSTVCVDDVKSAYYNQITNNKAVTWTSAEQLIEKNPQYSWGVVVNYNTNNPKPGAGSCIFMHVWSNENKPTVGCIAMSAENMKNVLAWLDTAKKPMIAIYPIDVYKKLNYKNNLPTL